VAAVLAGLTAAMALAFSVPFWSAATRLQYQSFDLLLVLAVFYLLVMFARTGWLFLMMIFAFGYGVGTVESTMFLLLLPVAGVAAWSGTVVPASRASASAALTAWNCCSKAVMDAG
jgi:hypothetical protein